MSFVKHKPEPLGTGFNNIADGVTGNMVWLDIQEGKEHMKNIEFHMLGSTSTFTLRGIKRTRGLKFVSFP